MNVQEKLLTAEDLAAMPDDRKRRELVKGRLIEMSPPKLRHGLIQTLVARFVGAYASEHKLGYTFTEVGCILSKNPDTVRAPDVAFLAKGRLKSIDFDAYLPVVPDLVIEIVSPGDTVDEILDKVHEYFEAGVILLWVFQPQRQQVYVYTSPEDIQVINIDGTLDGGDVLPGFKLPLRDVFKGLGE